MTSIDERMDGEHRVRFDSLIDLELEIGRKRGRQSVHKIIQQGIQIAQQGLQECANAEFDAMKQELKYWPPLQTEDKIRIISTVNETEVKSTYSDLISSNVYYETSSQKTSAGETFRFSSCSETILSLHNIIFIDWTTMKKPLYLDIDERKWRVSIRQPKQQTLPSFFRQTI
ncbi:hypothetical protein GLOIN_2v454026 [Rhizophagus clarus]|nr:hypothetical protein GLOIN_2v454026 [Rhizophagus clarus]